MSNLYFTANEMADITDGNWENYDENLKIKEFHHTYHYLHEGDAFVIISANWPNKGAYRNNVNKIKGAISKGINCLISPKDIHLDESVAIPVLRVENTYFAMKSLAKYASQNTKAKKVLITGSYGKTGFKIHLNHVSEEQVNSYTRHNSANFTASNYCNLASIKKETELFFMEIPIANKDKMKRRVKLISPDICVITSIGHEGIERFKTIDRIIRYKLLVASGLSKGSKLLLPYDDRYYTKIRDEASKYEDVKILTFGSSSRCNANVLYKKYSDFGWDVIAKIENKVVAYRVPFMEEYAVSNSLGVLLCAYHLGLDIHASADKYYSCENFKSSGLLYNVELNGKNFFLYDQCNRGGIEGYESLFKTLSYIKPKKDGKKILITSEFVDYIDGEMDNINLGVFQKLIQDSKITHVFSVEKFSEHINVLKDKSIWKNHSIEYKNIQEEIFNTIENNDIVSVKGIFDSSLTAFMQDFKAIDGITIKEVKSVNTMQGKNDALRSLRTLEVSDIDDFKDYVNKENKKGWIYYFPFIYFWSLSSSREILIAKNSESMSVFLLNYFHRSSYPRLQMYLPTLPLINSQQKNAIETIYKYKGYRTADIIWVDQSDVSKLKDIYNLMQFKYKTFEYLYKPKLYKSLEGSQFRNLRHQLVQMSKNENTITVPYEKKYEEECLNLYTTWLDMQKNKYQKISDEKYTKNCIKYFDLFNNEDLNGLVVLQNSKVMSYAFVGKINDKILSFFIGKSDHSLKGVQSYIRHTLLLENQEYDLVNDGVGISNGLDASKRRFGFPLKHKVFKARIEE